MKKVRKPFKQVKLLISFFALSLIIGCAPTQQPSVDNILSIQAFTDLCFYGQKLTKVEIVYKKDVDLSNMTPSSFILLDRGYSNPDFVEVDIISIDVNGNVATLNISQDTEASADNALIYSGDNASGSRTKNPLGLYPTGPWYRGIDGVIYFGEEDSEMYKAKTSSDGYQTRECLELKLYHAGENESVAACLANNDWTYNTNGLWQPTVDANYGEGGL